MKRAIVVGGGLAGLSAAVYLSEKEFEITLLESSPKLGGRTYSLYNEQFEDYFDNGQHILLGCYEETLKYLAKTNSLSKLDFQASLDIPLIIAGGAVHRLKSANRFYPFNLLYAILNYKALSVKERFKVLDFFLDLMCCESCDLKNKTILEWFECKKQTGNTIKSLWEILVVGIMNTTPEKASAELFNEVLKRIFLDGNEASTMIIPKVGLTELFADGAVDYITDKNGKIILSEKIISFETKENKIVKLYSDKKHYENFDAVILAIPTYAAEKIYSVGNNTKLEIPQLAYSPILNVHIWLKQNPFREKFYGLVGSKVHWLFNHGKHISITTSAAEELIGIENNEIKRQICSEIEKYFPIFNSEMVADYKVIKEKRATFIPDIASNESRKNFKSSFENIIFAGDWVETGLPSTIESAVLSGRLAAESVITSLK